MDFSTAEDKIVFNWAGVTTLAQLKSMITHVTVSGGNSTFDFSNGPEHHAGRCGARRHQSQHGVHRLLIHRSSVMMKARIYGPLSFLAPRNPDARPYLGHSLHSPQFPGQFRRLARRLDEQPGVKVYTLGDESWMPKGYSLPNAERFSYPGLAPVSEGVHPWVRNFDTAVRRGQLVVLTLLKLKHQGFEPAVIYIHPGWGDGLFLKELFPNTTVIGLFEYFYHARGADVGFDPEFPLNFDDLFRVRMLNTVQQHALESCDVKLSPTTWQKSRYPRRPITAASMCCTKVLILTSSNRTRSRPLRCLTVAY